MIASSSPSTAARLPTATVRTRHGDTYSIRPIHPDDKWALNDAFRRLSPRTRYQRFLVAHERLSAGQLAYLTELDFHDHVAWGVLSGDEAIAVARFIRDVEDPTTAEFAVTVLDSYQGRGIGPMLLEVLGVAARSRGIGRLTFEVLSENRPMLKMLERFGASIEASGDLAHCVLDVGRIPGPDVVDGDLGQLMARAARERPDEISPSG